MAIIFYCIIFVTIVLAVSKMPQIPRETCQESTNKFRPYPQICNIYYKCEKGQMFIKMCKFGLNFNSELGICDDTGPKDCVMAQEITIENQICPQMFIGPRPDPVNCRQYIICFLGEHYYKKCKLDFVYNYQTGFCDHPSNVSECSEDMKRHNTANNTSNYNFTSYYMEYLDDNENKTDESFHQVNDSNSNLTINYIFSSHKKLKNKNDTVQREIPAVSQTPQSTNLETVLSSSKPYTSSLHNYWTRHWGSSF